MKAIIAGILFLVLITTTQHSFGQGTIAPELNKTQIRATILSLGVSVEQKLGEKQSFNLIAGMQPGFSSYTEVPGGTEYDFYVAPFVTGEIRNYYNRKYVKKELGPNSGNYVALAAGYNMSRINNDKGKDFYEESYENSFFVGPVWGIQRNYKNGFHLNFSIGLGYQSGEHLDGAIRTISTGGIGFYFK